jgi:hypothetical protein
LKTLLIASLALLATLNVQAASKCYKGACTGDNIFVDIGYSVSPIRKDKINAILGTSTVPKAALQNEGAFFEMSDIYIKRNSIHIGKVYKKRNNASYKILAVNTKNQSKFVAQRVGDSKYRVVNFNDLIIPQVANEKSKSWNVKIDLNKTTGTINAVASIENKDKDYKLKVACSTLDQENIFSVEIPKTIGRSLLYLNSDVKVSIFVKDSKEVVVTSSTNYQVEENQIIKTEPISDALVEVLKKGNEVSLKIEAIYNEESELLGSTKFSLSSSKDSLNKIENTCMGNLD